MNKESIKNVLLLLAGVACLASGGIFVKISELGPIATAFYRILLAMPLAFAWARLADSPQPRTGMRGISGRDCGLFALSGAFLAFDLILWHISFHYTTVANANLLANLTPFVVVPISYFLFGMRQSFLFLAGLLVAVGGVVLLMSGKIAPSPENFLGDALAIATAVFYGLYLVTVGQLRKRYNAGDVLFWGGFSALAILALAAMIWESAWLPTGAQGWLVLICLAVLSHIGGQGLVAVGFGRLPINFASVALLMQPIFSAIYAFLIFTEKLSHLEIIGIGVVLLGIYLAKVGTFETSGQAKRNV